MSGTGPTDLTVFGFEHVYSGKVRDLYEHPDRPDRVLMVASDRVSAFDHVLQPGIPGKGAMLTELTLWWFAQFPDVPNHLAGTGRVGMVETTPGAASDEPEAVLDNAMLVRKLDMLPIEAVVRGYLAGSGWVEYQQSQSVCGVPLPAGLQDGDRLPEPIYTPAYKAPQGEHDENITYERTVELVGEPLANGIRTASLELFGRASRIAEQHGIILADTKFEWGIDPENQALTLGDEVLTSDSSRYWDAELYDTGDRTASFDKQIVRNWLKANWDGQGEPPTLPHEIVEQTAARYRELLERLCS